MLVKCKNTDVIIQTNYDIGDYVRIIDTGGHYSTYANAFKQFWGNEKTYPLDYRWQYRDYFETRIKYQLWVVKAFLIHEQGYDVLMHLQSLDGKKNIVFSASEKYSDGRKYCQVVKKGNIKDKDTIVEVEKVKNC